MGCGNYEEHDHMITPTLDADNVAGLGFGLAARLSLRLGFGAAMRTTVGVAAPHHVTVVEAAGVKALVWWVRC
jgi:hypothetical protein